MADHAVGDEGLPIVVEIKAPGVCCAAGNGFEDVFGWMITPDTARLLFALGVGLARLADQRRRRDAIAAVEPTVRSPDQAVHDVVLSLERPAVEDRLLRPLGSVRVAGGNEHQPRRRAEPDTAKAQLEARQVGRVVAEDLALVKVPRIFAVAEDQHAIVPLGRPVRVRIALGDPQPAAIVGREADRLRDVRLAREERHMKAIRNCHVPWRLLRRQRAIRRCRTRLGAEHRLRDKRRADDQNRESANSPKADQKLSHADYCNTALDVHNGL